MIKETQYQVWVRSRGFNPYGANLNVPCKNALFNTREEAEAYIGKDNGYGNQYYIVEL